MLYDKGCSTRITEVGVVGSHVNDVCIYLERKEMGFDYHFVRFERIHAQD